MFEFEQLRYAAAMPNPGLDEILFVTMFLKGLKTEIQNPVQSQLPATVDRAALLAKLQQDIQEKSKFKVNKPNLSAKGGVHGKQDNRAGNAAGDLSKERQLRDYRRLHNLCYACGENGNMDIY